MEFYFGGIKTSQVLKIQKRCIRIFCGAKKLDSCRPLFNKLKIAPITHIYILRVVCFVDSNLKSKNIFYKTKSNHNYKTRKNLYVSCHTNIKLYFEYSKIYKHLPDSLKSLAPQKKIKM